MSQKEYDELTGQDSSKPQATNKGKVLIQCLDRSGSMSGAPMTALKQGADLVGESVFGDGSQERAFQRVITIPYGSAISVSEDTNLNQYKSVINNISAGSMTDFKKVFDQIVKIV